MNTTLNTNTTLNNTILNNMTNVIKPQTTILNTLIDSINPQNSMVQVMLGQLVVSYLLSAIGIVLNKIIPISSTIFQYILSFFHIYVYDVSGELTNMLNPIIFKNCVTYKNNQPFGIIFGYWFIGYTNYNETERLGLASGIEKTVTHKIIIITTQNQYNKLTSINEFSLVNQYKYQEIAKSLYGNTVITRNACCSIEPNKYQRKVICDIINNYNKRSTKSYTCFISGQPGTGKSTIASMITNIIGGSLFTTWQIDSNVTLSKIYNDIRPSKTCPLIILINEIDETLYQIIENTKIQNKNVVVDKDGIPVSITKKKNWCDLFDKIDSGIYPYIIILMTSNVNPTKFDKIDASYLRKGRIHSRYIMDNVIS